MSLMDAIKTGMSFRQVTSDGPKALVVKDLETSLRLDLAGLFPGFELVHLGQNLTGRGYDTIVLACGPEAFVTGHERRIAAAWIEEVLPTRLLLGGRLVNLATRWEYLPAEDVTAAVLMKADKIERQVLAVAARERGLPEAQALREAAMLMVPAHWDWSVEEPEDGPPVFRLGQRRDPG